MRAQRGLKLKSSIQIHVNPCPNLAFHKMGMNQIQTNQLPILVHKLQQNTPH
jgi:hypothetical protein